MGEKNTSIQHTHCDLSRMRATKVAASALIFTVWMSGAICLCIDSWCYSQVRSRGEIKGCFKNVFTTHDIIFGMTI